MLVMIFYIGKNIKVLLYKTAIYINIFIYKLAYAYLKFSEIIIK